MNGLDFQEAHRWLNFEPTMRCARLRAHLPTKAKAPAGTNCTGLSVKQLCKRKFKMKDNTNIAVAAITGLHIPADARAVLVSHGPNDTLHVQPVEYGQSVLNIRAELLDHLNAYPHSTEWLEDLRDYCNSRLGARADAAKTGGVVLPREHGRWEIVHVNAFSDCA